MSSRKYVQEFSLNHCMVVKRKKERRPNCSAVVQCLLKCDLCNRVLSMLPTVKIDQEDVHIFIELRLFLKMHLESNEYKVSFCNSKFMFASFLD